MDEEAVINGVLRNLAGGKKIRGCWDFLKEFDIIIILETWVEEVKEEDFIRNLDNDYIWKSKSAVRIKDKEREIYVEGLIWNDGKAEKYTEELECLWKNLEKTEEGTWQERWEIFKKCIKLAAEKVGMIKKGRVENNIKKEKGIYEKENDETITNQKRLVRKN